jgi:hypothetical protein
MLAKIAKCLAAILIPPLAKAVREELAKQMPVLIRAVIVALTQVAGQFSVNTVDKITDIIPGHLDDEVLDNLVTNAMDALAGFGIKL